MRRAATLAVVAVLIGIAALCPALACFSPASHPCCPHHAPAAVQDCPSLVLEKGKIARLVSSAIAPPAPCGTPLLPLPSSFLPAATVAYAPDVFLAPRVLRI